VHHLIPPISSSVSVAPRDDMKIEKRIANGHMV
jgi:hypothetical protein